MGLIETEITELRQLLQDVMDDKISVPQASMQLAIFSEVSKRERLMFDIWKAASDKKGVLSNVLMKNLMGKGTAIKCGGDDTINLMCSEMGGTLITLEECLDFSGHEKNLGNCQRCGNFTLVRKRLLVPGHD